MVKKISQKVTKVMMFVRRDNNHRQEFFVVHQKNGISRIITGHVGVEVPSETPYKAVEREIKEELGIEPEEILDLQKSVKILISKDKLSTEHIFLVKIPNQKIKYLETDDPYSWCSICKLSKILTHAGQKRAVKILKEYLKKKKAE